MDFKFKPLLELVYLSFSVFFFFLFWVLDCILCCRRLGCSQCSSEMKSFSKHFYCSLLRILNQSLMATKLRHMYWSNNRDIKPINDFGELTQRLFCVARKLLFTFPSFCRYGVSKVFWIQLWSPNI